MYVDDTPRRVRVGTLTRRQLATLVSVLTPYSDEPITAPVIELATKLARTETAQANVEAV